MILCSVRTVFTHALLYCTEVRNIRNNSLDYLHSLVKSLARKMASDCQNFFIHYIFFQITRATAVFNVRMVKSHKN